MDEKVYRIGELAQANQIKTDTLRFYEKHGLLTPSSRSDAGYRLYSETDAQKLTFILRAKAMGFSLNEISDLLSIEVNKANRVCADVKAVVELKLNEVEAKITELIHFQTSLKKLSKACCGGPYSAENCSILEALESSISTPQKHHRQICDHKGK